MNRTDTRVQFRRGLAALAKLALPALLTPPAADCWALLKAAGTALLRQRFGGQVTPSFTDPQASAIVASRPTAWLIPPHPSIPTLLDRSLARQGTPDRWLLD